RPSEYGDGVRHDPPAGGSLDGRQQPSHDGPLRDKHDGGRPYTGTEGVPVTLAKPGDQADRESGDEKRLSEPERYDEGSAAAFDQGHVRTAVLSGPPSRPKQEARRPHRRRQTEDGKARN